MMGRNKRGIRRASMRVRLAVAAAVLVGGGAAGVVAVNASHNSTATTAASAGYATSWNSQMSWQQGMSWAMDNWNTSWQQSLVVITKTVTVKTVVVAPFHNHMFVAQRGTVVTKDPWEFVVKSSNGNFNLWHFNRGTKFVNIGNNKTGWNAMSGGTMSSWGSWNWSDYTNSSWNTHMKTLPKGALVFVFGVKEHGQLHAQLVLFAAPSSSNMTAVPSTSSTGWVMNSSNNGLSANNQVPAPGSTFSGSHS